MAMLLQGFTAWWCIYVPEEYGFGYIKTLAENFYGVEDVELIKAVGLDIYEADASAIINEALAQIEKIS